MSRGKWVRLTAILAVILSVILIGLLIIAIRGTAHRKNAEIQRSIETQAMMARESTEEAVHTALSLTPNMPTPTQEITSTLIPTATSTSIPVRDPANWQSWSILPDSISSELIALYQTGLTEGKKPNRFSKIGDSNSTMPSFLGCFDSGEKAYVLGEYASLQATIDQFNGSFARHSRGAINGITALGLDIYHTYDDEICWPYESPTSCEYRLWEPSIAFIALGTNDALLRPEDFDTHLRSLVQKTMDRHIVPILVTKADNVEGTGQFNQMIAEIAVDFDLPVWNLWRAMAPLPNHGLLEGDVHPSYRKESLCDFSGSDLKMYGWNVRNLTGMEALARVYHLLNP